MLDFRALLPKDLFTFALAAFGLNYDFYAVFHVGFRNFCKKTNTENQLVTYKRGCPFGTPFLFLH